MHRIAFLFKYAVAPNGKVTMKEESDDLYPVTTPSP